MNVQVYKGISGCRNAKGIAVVIDVFRATSTICCLLKSNPPKILLARSPEEMELSIKKSDVECFSEITKSGAKHDNSPIEALTVPLQNKIAVILTRNGTVAFDSVRHCSRVFAAAFVNIDAIVEYLLRMQPVTVSLIAIGHINRNEEIIEDNLCAEMLRSRLMDESVDELAIRKKLVERIKQRRLDSESPQGFSVELDIALCCAIGILDVVPEIIYDNHEITVINARN